VSEERERAPWPSVSNWQLEGSLPIVYECGQESLATAEVASES
jgi:hypothetical protein